MIPRIDSGFPLERLNLITRLPWHIEWGVWRSIPFQHARISSNKVVTLYDSFPLNTAPLKIWTLAKELTRSCARALTFLGTFKTSLWFLLTHPGQRTASRWKHKEVLFQSFGHPLRIKGGTRSMTDLVASPSNWGNRKFSNRLLSRVLGFLQLNYL